MLHKLGRKTIQNNIREIRVENGWTGIWMVNRGAGGRRRFRERMLSSPCSLPTPPHNVHAYKYQRAAIQALCSEPM